MVTALNPKELSLELAQRILETQDSIALTPLMDKLPEIVKQRASALGDQIWIASSGSFRQKFIGLSRAAINVSAGAVNEWLCVDRSDCWALALPFSHIGGFSILARARLSQSRVVHYQEHWQPYQFCSFVAREKCTLCSLVPTQLFDLLAKDLRAPPSLRVILIGGAALSPLLYKKARTLGWPILPSYGLTECASQVATAELRSLETMEEPPALHVLPHVECSLDSERILHIQSESLLSAYITTDNEAGASLTMVDKSVGFKSADIVELTANSAKGTTLRILGRADRQIKIKGWLICLEQLEERLQVFFDSKGLQILFALGTQSSLREGDKLILHISSGSAIESLLPELNAYLEQFERVTVTRIIEHTSFPRLANGKVDYRSLRDAHS